jgi:CRP-like cAMP-binding protein
VAIERDGRRLNTLGAGDFFGEIAIIDGGPRTATVTAEEPSLLYALERDAFLAAVTGSAQSLAAAEEVVSARLGAGPLLPQAP